VELIVTIAEMTGVVTTGAQVMMTGADLCPGMVPVVWVVAAVGEQVAMNRQLGKVI
jgi:hypothetical protein